MDNKDQDYYLHKYLDGVTEFKHESNGGYSACKKCGKECLRAQDEPICPIPDTYPGSDPDIAEKIREWLGKQLIGPYAAYVEELNRLYRASLAHKNLDFGLWTHLNCTPQDKINAFVEVCKEME